MPGDSRISLQMPLDDYFQTQYALALIEGSLSDYRKLTATDIVYGRLPENSNEIVVDRMILEQVIDTQTTTTAGYGTVRSFVGEIYL